MVRYVAYYPRLNIVLTLTWDRSQCWSNSLIRVCDVHEHCTSHTRITRIHSLMYLGKQTQNNDHFENFFSFTGIFIDPSIWPAVQSIVDSLDYNIYPFPSSNDLLYSKAAHLLYELPWSNPNSSIAVRSESAETSNKFTAICRHEHLCLENFPSDHTIFIILGLTRSVSFATNGTLIVVLSGRDMLFVSGLL